MINPPPASDLLVELERFRDTLADLSQNYSVDWLSRPAEESWSLTEIACHLRDVEQEVHLPRLQAILETDGAFIPGVDADEWALTRGYRRQDGQLAISEFLAARDKTIAFLSSLSPDAWLRQGQHTFFGPTSLQELVYLAVQHDRVHARQIEELAEDSSARR